MKTDGPNRSARLFPSFFLGGFECSTAINFDRVRIDEIALTGHDRHARGDYNRLRRAGIFGARDGVRWDLVDQKGILDFHSALPLIEAAFGVTYRHTLAEIVRLNTGVVMPANVFRS